MIRTSLNSTLENAFASDDLNAAEKRDLVRLMVLFATLPAPPDPVGLFGHFETLQQTYRRAIETGDGNAIEEAFLNLYCHVHGHEAPYTADERERVNRVGGYWCHAGGISPIIRASRHLSPQSVSVDFGAGNGLQLLLMQKIFAHRRSIMIEISTKMISAGKALQSWLDIPKDRVEWRAQDLIDIRFPLPGAPHVDFVYLYRPLKPEGRGRVFYGALARWLERMSHPVVVFSIADCLERFLTTQDINVFYTDGHLTCFEKSMGLNKSG